MDAYIIARGQELLHTSLTCAFTFSMNNLTACIHTGVAEQGYLEFVFTSLLKSHCVHGHGQVQRQEQRQQYAQSAAHCLSFISGCLGLGRDGPAEEYSRYSMSSPPDRAAMEPDRLDDVA